MAKDKMTAILKLAEEKGILRPKDVREEDLPRQYVYRLYEQGKLEKIGRGLYKLPEKQFSMSDTQLEACKKITHGVMCLKTALRFHDMTTQNPHKIWMAIEVKAWEPEVDLPMKFIRMSGESFESGIEEHEVDNVLVRVYSAAKTVADCFKFRSKIGLEVCLAALRDFRRQNMGTMDDIWKYAKINRVHKIMRPYMEAQQ
jgi:predicted transcriptional regulator of viral defense system